MDNEQACPHHKPQDAARGYNGKYAPVWCAMFACSESTGQNRGSDNVNWYLQSLIKIKEQSKHFRRRQNSAEPP